MVGIRRSGILFGAVLLTFGGIGDAIAGEMCQQTSPEVVVAAVIASVATVSAAMTPAGPTAVLDATLSPRSATDAVAAAPRPPG
ncbi:MAG TPA: hypothetical protein VET85_13985 [Stellaceae bacterium]|nr:hypothetical protein [Stellaceae bacterium]